MYFGQKNARIEEMGDNIHGKKIYLKTMKQKKKIKINHTLKGRESFTPSVYIYSISTRTHTRTPYGG